MTTLQADETVASQNLLSSPNRFKLDIFSGEQWTHSLELPTGKCTIGSSPSCQICLTEEHVSPLHCLLVQDAEGVTATGWTPGMLLNDQEFSTAPLFVGDILSIGNLHLRLMFAEPIDSELRQEAENDLCLEPESALTPEIPSDPQPHQTVEVSDVCEVSEPPAVQSKENSPLREMKLAQSTQQARERCRRLLNSLRQQRALVYSSQKEAISHANLREAVEHERDSLATELDQLRKSIAERDSQHAAELDRITDELSEAYDKTTLVETSLNDSEARHHVTQHRNDELTAECEQLNSSSLALQEENNQLTQEITDRDNRITELLHELGVSQESTQVAEDKLAEQVQDNEELSSELDRLRNELFVVSSDNERFKEEIQDLQSTSSDHQQQLLSAREELCVTTEQLDQQSSEQESLSNELAALQTEFQESSTEKEKLIKEAAEQHKRNELLEIDVKSLTSEWQQSLAEITRLKKTEEENSLRIEELEKEYASFDKDALVAITAERDQLADQLRVLQEEIDAREDLLQNASQRLEQLHAIVSESEEAQAELNEDIAARIGQIELLTSELEELRANVIRPEEERIQYTERLTERENTIVQLHTEFEALRTSISQVEQERDEIAERFASQAVQLAALTAEFEGKQSELNDSDEAREQYVKSLSAHESKIEQLNKELDTLRTERSEVQQERDQLVGRLASQESHAADLSSELETIRSKDSQMDQEHEEYVQCIAVQVDQIEELTSQLESVRKNFSLVEQEREHVAKRIAERDATIEQLTADLDQSRELMIVCSEQVQQLNSAYQQSLADLEQAREMGQGNATEIVESLTIKLPTESEAASERANEGCTEHIESPTVAITTPIDLKEEQPEEPPVEFQPPSFIDQYSHLLDENRLGEVEDFYPSTAEPVSEVADLSLSKHPLPGADGGEDDDLDAYMSSLMRRVRGEMAGDSLSASGPDAVENQESTKNSVPDNDCESDPTTSQPNGLLDIAELKAACSNPTQPIDLTFMRELANSSARSAIAKHRKRSHFESALGKFLVTSIAGGAAVGMIASSVHYAHPLFLGGCAVGVVSIYWGLKLFGELLQMIRDGGAESTTADLREHADILPVDGDEGMSANSLH